MSLNKLLPDSKVVSIQPPMLQSPPIPKPPMPHAGYKQATLPPELEEVPLIARDTRHPTCVLYLVMKQYEDAIRSSPSDLTDTPSFGCDACGKVESEAAPSYSCFPCEWDVHVGCLMSSPEDEKALAFAPEDLPPGKRNSVQLLVRDADRRHVRFYRVGYSQFRKALQATLTTEAGLPGPLASLVAAYSEQHRFHLPKDTRYNNFPFAFRLGADTQKDMTGVELVAGPLLPRGSAYAQYTGRHVRFEFARILGVHPAAVVITVGDEKAAEPAADDAVLLRSAPIMPVIGRPYMTQEGDALTAALNISLSAQPAAAKQVAEQQQEHKEQSGSSSPSTPAPSFSSAWSSSLPGLSKLREVSSVPASVRYQLAAAWAADGLAEHASIASFARVTLQLMTVGAPPGLLLETQRAAADEVRHARLCFALSACYSGKPVEPGTFPVPPSMAMESSPSSVAASTAIEGCVEETLSALVAAEQAQRCEDPVVRTALQSLVRDEARHAALAWRTVEWCIAQAGANSDGHTAEDVRAKVHAAFRGVDISKHGRSVEAAPEGLEAYGRLAAGTEAKLRRVAFEAVVTPWAERVCADQAAPNATVDDDERAAEGALRANGFVGAAAAVGWIAAAWKRGDR